MKYRLKKKLLRRNVETIADKCPLAFKNRADKKAWISEVVTKHPAIMRKEHTR